MAGIFLGQYSHQIDEKNRIRIPTKLKALLGESPIMTVGMDKSLYIYSSEQYEKIMEKKFGNVMRGDYSNEEQCIAFNAISSMSVYLEEDKQGRVTISQKFLDYAEIKKNVVSCGSYDKVTLVAEEVYRDSEANMSREDIEKALRMF